MKQILELKNTIIAIKKSRKGFNRRLNQAEERISKLKDRSLEITKLIK